MSRVGKPCSRFMNTSDYGSGITQPSKIVRNKDKVTDYTKAKTLSSWLFLKYGISYRTYRNKSKNRRDELRDEFTEDTGRQLLTKEEQQQEETYQLFAEMGIPFSPTGEPLGIGWDD